MKPRLTHICLHVNNLQACIEFYQKYCRLEVIEDRTSEGKGSVYMTAPDSQSPMMIQLMLGGETLQIDQQSERHFGFEVDAREDIDTIENMAEQDGILVFKADEYMPGAYLCTVRDPNGNPVEFCFNHQLPR